MKKLAHTWYRVGEWIIGHKARFFLMCGVLSAAAILYLDYRNGFDQEGVLVEAHGMLFDVILFGIILNIYEHYLDKRRKKEEETLARKLRIARYLEEIEDYLGWDEKEATYRIVGNIRRLNREGVTDIYLWNAYLEGALLGEVDLMGADLWFANLNKAELGRANLQGTVFRGASLIEAHMVLTNLKYAKLDGAKLHKVDLSGADLQEANLSNSDLFGSTLEKVNLEQANLTGTNLEKVNLRKARLLGVKIISANPEMFNSPRISGSYFSVGTLQKYTTNFKGAILHGATAYESQKEVLVEAGADISQMKFLPDPEGEEED